MTQLENLKIIDSTFVSVDTWKRYWQNCRWSTFFESPDWSEVWHSSFGSGFSATPIELTFSDGFRCLLPATSGKRAKGLVTNLEMCPSGIYGGPLSTEIPSARHLSLISKHLNTNYADYYFQINPFLLKEIQLSEEVFAQISGYTKDFTQAVNLDKSVEEITRKLRKKRIVQTAKSISKKGIRLQKGSDITPFYDVYQQAQQRWGSVSVSYPMHVYENLLKYQNCDYWIALDDKESFLGGGIFLIGNQSVNTWLTIFTSESMKLRVSELFYSELIFHYKKAGLSWFDFNPSGGNEGVSHFKSRFATERLDTLVFSQTSVVSKLAKTLMRK
ncbi:MAG: hypothetical protein LAT57_00400 [Balneolales bacterium]|nr:hypothetical protein [Balneolales bacterium]